MEAAAPRPFSWVLFPTLFPAFPALCPSLLACFQGCACVLGTEIAFCAIRHIRHSFATPHPWSETVRHSQAELVTVFVAQYNVWGLHRKLWVHHGWLMHIYPHNPTQILIFGWTPLTHAPDSFICASLAVSNPVPHPTFEGIISGKHAKGRATLCKHDTQRSTAAERRVRDA